MQDYLLKKIVPIEKSLNQLLEENALKSYLNDIELYGMDAVLTALFDEDVATAGVRYRNAYCHYIYNDLYIPVSEDQEEKAELSFMGNDGNMYLVTCPDKRVFKVVYDVWDSKKISDFESTFNEHCNE